MSERNTTDYEWAQRALNALYLELPAPVASDCIPKLKRMIELYEADNARLRKVIEEAPHELMCAISTFGKWDIANKGRECNCWKRNALEGK